MTDRFDPFAEMDRLLRGGPRAAGGALPMDVYRDGDTFVVQLDLPGVDPASIDVDVDDRVLTVRAERRPVTGGDVRWLARERTTGTFARQLSLGRGLALDAIQAEYADGVLRLVIPVAEEAKPRKVTVRHEVTTLPGRVDTDAADGSVEHVA